MKRFHVYTDQELKREYDEPFDVPQDREGYIMILHTWCTGPCGGEIKGTVAYENMLHGLLEVKNELEDIKIYMEPGEWEKRRAAIYYAIGQIKEKKSDQGIQFPDVGLDQSGTGLMYYANGYWGDAVSKMIEHINKDKFYLKRCLEEELEEEDMEDAEKKAETMAAGFDIGEYLKGRDMESREFFEEFLHLCHKYNERLNA